MKNIDLLFKSNNSTILNKIKLNGKTISIKLESKNNLFTGLEIKKIINIVNTIQKKYGKLKLNIEFYFFEIQFIDKLTYVFLECICYYLINVCKYFVQIFMKVKNDIRTFGIKSSPLLLLNATKLSSVKKFPEHFMFDLFGYHFRRIIECPESKKTNYLGNLYEDIDRFLKPFGIEDDCRDEVALVITELVGNASEHALSDCLIDIDVVPNIESINNFYYGINIAVLNFSNKLLGDDINRNILENKNNNFSERYKKILKVYNNHKPKFDKKYWHEDFCNITTFQTKISGRETKFDTGGTGLPVLIKSLEDKSDTYRCYVISGQRSINFYSKFLEYDNNGWIGFNNNNNYFEDIPEEGVVNDCLIYMPGTAYNFNFIMKGEKL